MSGECGSSHPWAYFLNARWKAILWMREVMEKNDKQIAQDLSMDEVQVYLIRTSKHMPIAKRTSKNFRYTSENLE